MPAHPSPVPSRKHRRLTNPLPSHGRDMTAGPMTRHLLAVAWPVSVSFLVQTLYNLIDAFWLGKLGKTALVAPTVTLNIVFVGIALTHVPLLGNVVRAGSACSVGIAEVQVLDMDAVDSARKIRAFDDHVTAPLNGFRDAAEYYAECSSRRFLAGVGVPTLMVHSVDDPFLPATAIPRAEAAANDRLTLVLVPRGGHVGFVEGTPWSPRFWADETCADFVAGLLHEVAQRPTGRP